MQTAARKVDEKKQIRDENLMLWLLLHQFGLKDADIQRHIAEAETTLNPSFIMTSKPERLKDMLMLRIDVKKGEESTDTRIIRSSLLKPSVQTAALSARQKRASTACDYYKFKRVRPVFRSSWLFLINLCR
jgi:hypothetical protein